MKKKEKHGDSKDGVREFAKLKDFQDPEATIEYDEEEEDEQRQKKVKIPKAVYRVGIILVAVIFGLVLWLNRSNLTPDNILGWIKLQVMGTGMGEGFPVPIAGGNVMDSNFTQNNGMAAVLSDTAFTLLNSTGRSVVSLSHGFENPALCSAYGNYLLYNQGNKGYLMQAGADTIRDAQAPDDILAGAVSRNGRYALGMQSPQGASYLNVYLKNGTVQYNYLFARDYITAVALNYDASYGAACTVHSEKGEMVSKITIFNFREQDPIAEYETRGNLLLGVYWSENGNIYAVGDSSVVTADAASFEFREYSYDGRQLTAYQLDANRAFVSVSAYEHAGPGTILVFDGKKDLVKIEEAERAAALSASGGTIAALEGTEVVFYDYSTGREQGRTYAGTDARSLALVNEHMAYVLGVSEVRTVELS